MPIELIVFKASCGDNQINIEWTTASELNTAHFVVEKSQDLVNWNFISQVEATGSSTQENHYSAVDLEGVNGVFYYRLKQIDLNGQEKIHESISTSCENKKNSMVVYPNPARTDFTVEIQWNEPNTHAQLQILDLNGKVIKETNLSLKMGTSKLEYHPKNLQARIYWIHLKHKGRIHLTPICLFLSN